MPAGLQVFNDSNTVQIDDEYSNLMFIRKGTLTLTDGGTLDVVVTNRVSPKVAIRVTDNQASSKSTACLYSVIDSGSTRTFRYRVEAGIVGAVTTLEYFVFDRGTPVSSGFGLQTFNSAGELIFDSGQKYLAIDSVLVSNNYEADGFTFAGKSIVINTSRTYAIVFGEYGGYWTGQNIPANPPFPQTYDDRTFAIGMRSITGGFVGALQNMFIIIRQNAEGPTGTVKFLRFSFLVVDVTGY